MRRLPSHMAGRRILGLMFDGAPVVEPPKAGSSLVFGAAGASKTTSVSMIALMSMLSDRSRAMFINDAKNGEIAGQIGPMCVKHGRKFGAVDEFGTLGRDNPFRISPNPFGAAVSAYCDDPDELPFVIENIAHALNEEPTDDTKNFYWRESVREALALGIYILLQRNPYLCFPGALHALLADPAIWKAALIEAEDSLDANLRSTARQFLDMKEDNPEHYAQHMRGALTATKIFSYGALRNAGRSPDITHEELLRDGWITCFVNPVRHTDRLGTFYALHFLALMNAQLRTGAGRAEYNLDEFCNAPLRDVLNRLTVLRGFDGRVIFIAQSRQDIVRRYGEKETAILEENVTITQWLRFSQFEEAERVSKAMGESLNISRGLGLSSDKQEWSSNYSTGRDPVFSAYELMQLPPDEQIIYVTGVGFIHCKKFWQNQFSPYCFDLAENQVEGGRLPPDPKIVMPTGYYGGAP